jgi:hypothetical protein
MFRISYPKMLSTAIVAGVMAIGLAASSGAAQAKPGHGGHGGHGGWSHGHGGHGGGWGHRGHRGWGWGPRFVGYGYGCYTKPRFDYYGNYVGRVRICR